MPRNAACTRCTLSGGAHTVCLWGAGPAQATLMLVGQSPGKNEDDAGAPFVGDAGKVLNQALINAGLTREQLYITNALKCKPPGNRAGTDAELGACFMYLAEEVATVQPTVIVALGGDALKAVTGKSAIRGHRGHILDAHPKLRTSAKVVATWHPSYALHTPHQRQQIMADIAGDLKFAARLTSNVHGASSNLPAHTVKLLPPGYSAEQLATELKPLLEVKQLAIDLEWTVPRKGKEVAWPWTKEAKLLSIAISGYVPSAEGGWQPQGSVYTVALAWPPTDQRCRDVLTYFLQDKGLIYHNNMGDRLWLRSVGLPCANILGDTMYLAWNDNESQVLKLEVLAALYAGLPADWKIEKNWHEPPPTLDEWLRLLDYNAQDTYGTLLLHTALVKKIAAKPEPERGNIIRQYANMQLPVCKSFIKISENGLPMDKAGVKEQIIHWEKRLAEVTSQIAEIMDTTMEAAEEVAGSGTMIQAYLKERYGLETDGTSKEEFTPLYASHPVIKLFKEFQHIRNKLLNTQLRPWWELMDSQGDETVHSLYNIVTRTLRGSAQGERGSTVQQMLLFDMWGGDWMRRLVKAEPGYKLIAIDQSQVELRFIAWVANVKRLIELYNESRKGDAHYATAGWLNALNAYPDLAKNPVESANWYWQNRHSWMAAVTKNQRHYVKPVNFGLAYMQEPPGLQDYARANYGIDMTLSQAQAAYAGYHALYPEIKQCHERVTREYRRAGYVLTKFNTYRRSVDRSTMVMNTHIQGPAAIMTMLVQLTLDEVLEREFHHDDVRMRGQVHDNILFTVREGLVDQAAQLIQWHFEHPPTELLGVPLSSIPVPFVADVEISQRWGVPDESDSVAA